MAKPSQQDPDSVKALVKDLIGYGLGFSIPVAAITVGIVAAVGQWLWVIAVVPATVTLVVVIGLVARLVSRCKSLVQVWKVVGLLVGLAAGVALIWFGIEVNLNASTCDPQVSRCVASVNGIARGDSTESVGSQRFGTFLLSLIAIGPGILILYFVLRGARTLTRDLAGRRPDQR